MFTFSAFSTGVVIIVSVVLLISLMTILMMCLCCYAAPNDDESIDSLLLEHYTDRNPSSQSCLASASTVR